jgi:hypothetical protein
VKKAVAAARRYGRAVARGDHGRAAKLSPAPRRLAWALAWDLSPLRPDAFMTMDAQLWTEAVELRAAYEDGVAQGSEGEAMREQVRRRAEALTARPSGTEFSG